MLCKATTDIPCTALSRHKTRKQPSCVTPTYSHTKIEAGDHSAIHAHDPAGCRRGCRKVRTEQQEDCAVLARPTAAAARPPCPAAPLPCKAQTAKSCGHATISSRLVTLWLVERAFCGRYELPQRCRAKITSVGLALLWISFQIVSKQSPGWRLAAGFVIAGLGAKVRCGRGPSKVALGW